MFEYIVIIVVVVAAVWYVGRRLWRDARSSGCQDCACKRDSLPSRLIQIKPIDRKKY